MFKMIALVLMSLVSCCECVYLYSNFYAPLVNPRVLGYRVDVPFDERAGVRAREQYQTQHGYRGEKLIRELGNGRAAGSGAADTQMYGDVKLYYTYPGAYNNQIQ